MWFMSLPALQMAQEWVCSPPGYLSVTTPPKFKMFLPKITHKGHCCTPGPAGCPLKWFLHQDLVSPDLTEGALFEALISFLTAHLCKSWMFHCCCDQTREYI